MKFSLACFAVFSWNDLSFASTVATSLDFVDPISFVAQKLNPKYS